MNKINKNLMLGALLLVVAIPLTTWLVGKNQENRSKAASETVNTTSTVDMTVDGVCGLANGKTVSLLPEAEVACESGALNWMDSKATDGTYNWKCIGTSDGAEVDCSADKE